MKKIRIIISGDYNNVLLAEKFQKEIVANGAEATMLNLIELDLPLYTTREEAKEIPSKIFPEIDALAASDALIFVTPEYNGGVPPVLTNFIAWISRSGNSDWRASFNGKPAALATHSGSGGSNLLAGLRLQLSYLGMNTIGRTVLTHRQKELNLDSLKALVGLVLK